MFLERTESYSTGAELGALAIVGGLWIGEFGRLKLCISRTSYATSAFGAFLASSELEDAQVECYSSIAPNVPLQYPGESQSLSSFDSSALFKPYPCSRYRNISCPNPRNEIACF